jgi:hypothetical protein
MKEGWIKIYSNTLHHKIEIVKAVLEENSIPSHSINKLDSSYASLIGEIELYVPQENSVLAQFIIKENNL